MLLSVAKNVPKQMFLLLQQRNHTYAYTHHQCLVFTFTTMLTITSYHAQIFGWPKRVTYKLRIYIKDYFAYLYVYTKTKCLEMREDELILQGLC